MAVLKLAWKVNHNVILSQVIDIRRAHQANVTSSNREQLIYADVLNILCYL